MAAFKAIFEDVDRLVIRSHTVAPDLAILLNVCKVCSHTSRGNHGNGQIKDRELPDQRVQRHQQGQRLPDTPCPTANAYLEAPLWALQSCEAVAHGLKQGKSCNTKRGGGAL